VLHTFSSTISIGREEKLKLGLKKGAEVGDGVRKVPNKNGYI